MNGLISTISGASLISYQRAGRQNIWRPVVAIVGLLALLTLNLSASELHCPPWPNSAPQEIVSPEIPAQLTQILRYYKGSGLVAKFAEEKHVLILQRPLRSTGHIIFLPKQGLYRQLVTPFQQELLITATAVQQRKSQGPIEAMSLDRLPLAKAFVEGFLAVFSGSWESMQSHFRMFFATSELHWRLGLSPKHTPMSQIISCLILAGNSEHIDSLWIYESNGDITHDRFTDMHLLTPKQWDDYQGYFKWGQ